MTQLIRAKNLATKRNLLPNKFPTDALASPSGEIETSITSRLSAFAIHAPENNTAACQPEFA
ncbi:MAG TPA: hypothetical protein VFD58_06770 [Blastocatellia bacterium]|nr:hypothetical protein [Blastocatellia bacterium]